MGPKRLQKETRKFQKIIKIPLFVARWSFWHPLAVFGVHFCSPGRPFWPHYGRWGGKTAPKSFRKSLKLHCLSPGGNFGTLWLFWGSIFARLGALSGLIMAAGDVFCCQIVLGQVYLCLSVVIVTVISAPFKSRCARKCTNLLIFM